VPTSPFDPAELFSLAGRTALVTGGGRGIGAMIAEGLAAAGARVLLAARSEDEVTATADRLGALGPCEGIVADLSSTAGVTALVDEVAGRTDRLDILVNNAGAWSFAAIDAVPEHEWDAVMALNVKAVHYLTAALLPFLTKGATAEAPARVINIGSTEGIDTPVMPTIAYSTSKAAVHHLTRHQAAQLIGRHVLVNAIAPGLFPTQMSSFLTDDALRDIALSTIPLHRPGLAEEIAGAAVFLASRAGGYIAGQVLVVDGGRNGIGRADPIAGTR
jgi:NAD(P)-dependent dehydrogenase (short-subunit alcohol dehydrogenase family)